MSAAWYESCSIVDEAGQGHTGSERDGMIRDFVFLILFFVLLGVWFTGWLAFHIAGGMIHLLLILAVVFLIVHFFRRRVA